MARFNLLHRLRRNLRGRDSSFHPSHPSYQWFVLANIMVGTFMAVLDSTIVNVALPKIMASFGVSIDKIEWIITGYMLAMALSLPASGWLADKFGYKKIYTLGLALFTFGSFLCGLANDENFLIFGRVIQGLGGGCLMPIGMAIITREFPPEKRGIALGFWAVAAAASVSFGPLIGGYLVDNFSWQLIFDVNVPFGIIGIIITIIILREYKSKAVRKFDIIGFVSVSIFFPVVLYALSESTAASNSEGWSAPYILICFAISAISLAVFITTELIVEDPLIDLRLFKNHNFAMSSITLFIFGIGDVWEYFFTSAVPAELAGLYGSAIRRGISSDRVNPGAVSPLVGAASDKWGYKTPLLIGILLLAISFYINGFLSYLTEHDYIMFSLYIRGVGLGMMFTPLSAVSLLEVPHAKMGQASGLFNIVRQLGGSFGVALLATILSTRVNYHAQVYGESIEMNSQALRNAVVHMGYYAEKNAGSDHVKAQTQSRTMIMMDVSKQAFIQGVDDDFLIAGVITIIGGIPILFLHSKKKRNSLKAMTYE